MPQGGGLVDPGRPRHARGRAPPAGPSASSHRSSTPHSGSRLSLSCARVRASVPSAHLRARWNCWAASRCEASAEARSPARVACRRTAAPSAAPSAWWASRASSRRPAPPGGQHPGVHGRGPVGGDRLLDGQPGDLVAEPEVAPVGHEQPGVEQGVQAVRVGGGHASSRSRSARAPSRAPVSSTRRAAAVVPRRGRAPRREPSRAGPPGLAAQQLGDEVGIPTGQLVHDVGCEAGARVPARRPRCGQARYVDPPGAPLGGEMGEASAQGWRGGTSSSR